jgi:hypothetical protein
MQIINHSNPIYHKLTQQRDKNLMSAIKSTKKHSNSPTNYENIQKNNCLHVKKERFS